MAGLKVLPVQVGSHVSGGRDKWCDPLEERPADAEAAVWRALREVLDPEIPISLVDLGLVYGIEVVASRATVSLTYTATACPCMEFIREDVRDRLLSEPWLDEVEIAETWDPPWTRERITDEGRHALRAIGVGA